MKEERRFRYEPVEPVPDHWRRNRRDVYEQNGKWWAHYVHTPDPILHLEVVEMREVEQRRFVTEWEDISGS